VSRNISETTTHLDGVRDAPGSYLDRNIEYHSPRFPIRQSPIIPCVHEQSHAGGLFRVKTVQSVDWSVLHCEVSSRLLAVLYVGHFNANDDYVCGL
jgi:hypothetical protein